MRSKVTKAMLAVLVGISLLMGETAGNINAKTVATDVDKPSDSTTFVALEGKYMTEAKKALNRMNEIRREACQQGVPNPGNPSKKLTKKDYVPLKWSRDLEYMARIRAAEASIYRDHDRPNGKSCFTVNAPGNIFACGEVLAWNFSDDMITGIEQWYGEKKDWVKQKNDAVTGHYTSMINPENTYVGVGTFLSKHNYFPNTTCGRFGRGTEVDTGMMEPVSTCLQTVEVKKSALGGFQITPSEKTGYVGDSRTYSLTRKFSLNGQTGRVDLFGAVKWKSSKPSVAEVNSKGRVKMRRAGKTKITATSASGKSISFTLTVRKKISLYSMKSTSIRKITAGKKKLKIKWKRVKKNTMGYWIQYATDPNFQRNVKTRKIAGYKKTGATLKKLRTGKRYYVKVCTYYKMPSSTYFSAWSPVKSKRAK